MTRHHKLVLVDMPVRHTLARMEMDREQLSQQFERLVNMMDIKNFIILAR